MTEMQKAILAYRKTYKQGEKGGTMQALAELLGCGRRTLYYWLNGRPGNRNYGSWTTAHVEKIQEETLKRMYEQ